MVKQKLKVRFDVTVTKIENAPAALKGESIYLEWRRGRTHGCTDSVVLCDTDVAFRASPEDHSQFSFNCSMLREPKTMKISTKVMVLLLKIDVESMGSVFAASLGGDVIGRATFKLSNYATKTGATAQLCFALSEKCSVKPTPMVYVCSRCHHQHHQHAPAPARPANRAPCSSASALPSEWWIDGNRLVIWLQLSMHCEWLRADGKRLEPCVLPTATTRLKQEREREHRQASLLTLVTIVQHSVQSQGSSTMLVSGMPVATISDGDQTFALRPRGMTSAEFGGVGGDDDDTMTSESESDASDAGSDLDPDDVRTCLSFARVKRTRLADWLTGIASFVSWRIHSARRKTKARTIPSPKCSASRCGRTTISASRCGARRTSRPRLLPCHRARPPPSPSPSRASRAVAASSA